MLTRNPFNAFLFLRWWPFDLYLAFLCILLLKIVFSQIPPPSSDHESFTNHFFYAFGTLISVFCTLHHFVPCRPIEELTDHVVYSEPKVRDPNSNRKVFYVKSLLINHYYPHRHPPPPPPPQHHHERCGQPSPGSLTKRTPEVGATSSRGSAR